VWVLFAAIVVLIFGDSAYLMNVAHGRIAFGTWINAVGLIAMVAFALCSGARFVERPTSAKTSWLAHALPAAASLSSLIILLIRREGPLAWITSTLAALTIVGAIVRLVCSYYEARALADTGVLARTHELTGLGNRRGFQDAAARRLAEAGGQVAILVVDLDGFKDINDGLGHHTGDELLRMLGARLACESKAGSLVARIGGDEFAVLADDADGEADDLAARVLAAIRRPFALRGLELRVDASIGIATAPMHGGTLDELLRHADMTMYRAKAAHRGILRYSPGIERASDALRTIGQLRHALESEPAELVLHYQPKVDLLSGSLCGVEALVRWQHPERGLLPPAEFLPLAEKAHLMPLLTERVLERAFADMATWTRELRGQAVAVNLPADAVSDPALVQRIAVLLEASGTAPRQLQLEITEDFLMADLEGARVVLDQLRVLGVGISIDDYGTGYSSLAYLRDLPVDELKLDRAFVQPILADQRASAIVRSTIDLAHSLGLRMVAEGIEDVGTWHRLLAMGCDIGQGYLFARPQTGADLELALAAPDCVLSPGGYRASLARPDLPSSA
jgi:diguanylate cyclase (GGDEF)-like protein